MTTYHGGSEQPLDRDIDVTREAQKLQVVTLRIRGTSIL